METWTYAGLHDRDYIVKTQEKYIDSGYSFELIARTNSLIRARQISLIPRMINYIRKKSLSGDIEATHIMKTFEESSYWCVEDSKEEEK